ncbi:MAG TPA: signal peptidase I [Sporichthyaceae bacterium]|jgi:signal peptidase I|nr:signal peptidase I [Sporichthyaceae bacterium]
MDADGQDSNLLDLTPPSAPAEQASDGPAAPRRRSHRLRRATPRPETPRRRGTRAQLRGKRRRRIRRFQLVGLAASLLLMVSVRAWAVEAYFIPSPSMEATLAVGDRVLVDKLSYRFGGPQRGQVVVFDGADSFDPASATHHGFWNRVLSLIGASTDEDDFIKRVIGVPGDRVQCCDDQGRLLINGVPVSEEYLYPGDVPSLERFDVMVPPGRLWVMGDHRSRSADSRAHLGDPGGGTVPIDRVVGRAVAIVWPLRHFARLPIPAGFERLAH